MAVAKGFRSGLEDVVAGKLDDAGVPYTYESFKITYEVPARLAKYTPDFRLLDNGIIVETKGQFVTADRHKHKLIKEQHPELDIRFVFSRSGTRISKQSQTTYAMWCQSQGFLYADKSIPQAWIDEPPTAGRVEALNAILNSQTKVKK
ncbi:endodeoxyribonuclease [Mesorhizobium sp. B3-1-3]|nr:endodeoxyribonuclease [Mesorhizobium sp. B3-1-8]TPI75776.1 endodeoxyribonuclease [Mesorhizobium sp. B3-1-3]